MKPEKEMHFTALRRQDKLNRLAAQRLRVAGGKVEKYQAVLPARDIEAVIAAEKLANPDIGDLVPGKGVFLGTWKPKDRKGNSLGKIFNVFAAPEDLPGTHLYEEAVKQVAALKNWHGHNGADYANDSALYEALRKDEYKGGWFIPPLELLVGVGPTILAGARTAPVTQPDNLFDHRDKGAFKDTFMTAIGRGKSTYYRSSSETSHNQNAVWAAGFATGDTYWNYKTANRFSCRPVRLEPVT